MSNNTQTHNLPSGRIITTKDVMSLLGYKDSTTFWQFAKRCGLPFIRVSARRAVFRERDIEAFMDARTVGAPVRRPVIETAAMNYAARRGVEHREAE